jgi:PhnB protein
MNPDNTTFFAPHLAIKVVRPAMEFYQKAFDARVLRVWEHEGRLHVAEMEIDGALFHLHEETARDQQLSPEGVAATTVLIGVFTPDPDRYLRQAVEAGGRIISPMQDFDYGYRQGIVADPFGHQWMFQKKLT